MRQLEISNQDKHLLPVNELNIYCSACHGGVWGAHNHKNRTIPLSGIKYNLFMQKMGLS